MQNRFCASIVVCSKGSDVFDSFQSPFGEARSREGAILEYTENDAKGLHLHFMAYSALGQEAHILLIDPAKKEVINAFIEVNNLLSSFDNEETEITFCFAGHGIPVSGSLVLKDGYLSAVDVLNYVSSKLDKNKPRRIFDFLLDSCYSGAFLIEVIIEKLKFVHHVFIRDAIVSSCFDQKSWELSFLKQGAFSCTFLNKGNKYVDNKVLLKVIIEKDFKQIAKYTQRAIADSGIDPVFYLTLGRQNCIEFMNGHDIRLRGGSSESISDLSSVTKQTLESLILKLRASILE